MLCFTGGDDLAAHHALRHCSETDIPLFLAGHVPLHHNQPLSEYRGGKSSDGDATPENHERTGSPSLTES